MTDREYDKARLSFRVKAMRAFCAEYGHEVQPSLVERKEGGRRFWPIHCINCHDGPTRLSEMGPKDRRLAWAAAWENYEENPAS